MDASAFFTFSEGIIQDMRLHCGEEMCYRAAISRLHYGAFHTVKLLFHIEIPASETECCHKYVRNILEDRCENTTITDAYHKLEFFAAMKQIMNWH